MKYCLTDKYDNLIFLILSQKYIHFCRESITRVKNACVIECYWLAIYGNYHCSRPFLELGTMVHCGLASVQNIHHALYGVVCTKARRACTLHAFLSRPCFVRCQRLCNNVNNTARAQNISNIECDWLPARHGWSHP